MCRQKMILRLFWGNKELNSESSLVILLGSTRSPGSAPTWLSIQLQAQMPMAGDSQGKEQFYLLYFQARGGLGVILCLQQTKICFAFFSPSL